MTGGVFVDVPRVIGSVGGKMSRVGIEGSNGLTIQGTEIYDVIFIERLVGHTQPGRHRHRQEWWQPQRSSHSPGPARACPSSLSLYFLRGRLGFSPALTALALCGSSMAPRSWRCVCHTPPDALVGQDQHWFTLSRSQPPYAHDNRVVEHTHDTPVRQDGGTIRLETPAQGYASVGGTGLQLCAIAAEWVTDAGPFSITRSLVRQNWLASADGACPSLIASVGRSIGAGPPTHHVRQAANPLAISLMSPGRYARYPGRPPSGMNAGACSHPRPGIMFFILQRSFLFIKKLYLSIKRSCKARLSQNRCRRLTHRLPRPRSHCECQAGNTGRILFPYVWPQQCRPTDE